MSTSTPIAEKPLQEESEDNLSSEDKHGYAAFSLEHKLGFDPTKDLNLPSSYEEVNARLRRLQAGRSMENLN